MPCPLRHPLGVPAICVLACCRWPLELFPERPDSGSDDRLSPFPPLMPAGPRTHRTVASIGTHGLVFVPHRQMRAWWPMSASFHGRAVSPSAPSAREEPLVGSAPGHGCVPLLCQHLLRAPYYYIDRALGRASIAGFLCARPPPKISYTTPQARACDVAITCSWDSSATSVACCCTLLASYADTDSS